jgi:molybdenum cofactor guanylyltransferase
MSLIGVPDLNLSALPTEPDDLVWRVGAVVLCGGRSSRMGQPKALLPVGDEVMLQRVCRTIAPIALPIVVVAAGEQELPDLSNQWLAANWSGSRGALAESPPEAEQPVIRVARDQVEYRGPLAGLAAGISQIAREVDCVYASACDAPLLRPAFIRAMIAALGDADIAVPFDGRFHYPLSAVYRVSVLPQIEELLASDRLRPVFLFEKCRTREVSLDDLRRVDPELDSLCNTNTPEEYQQALVRIAQEAVR